MTHSRQHHQPAEQTEPIESPSVSLTRREFFKSAGATGLAAAASPLALLPGEAEAAPADGTPEQIHLTWGEDPSSSVFVSWASPTQSVNPRVTLRRSASVDTIHATIRYYHAPGADQAPTSTYELFETLVIAKDRRDEKHR